MNGFLLIGVYLLVTNITLFIIMGVDKRQAVKRLRRVSEKNYLAAGLGRGCCRRVCGHGGFQA
ncbi:DUF1294 domain-containing protein [Halobacillus andaensis]|uniref:DUF1294 domain-containing protein n=1 Tax=Halobacillus andaensis TaxID=1176239 RepID=UPI003D71019A